MNEAQAQSSPSRERRVKAAHVLIAATAVVLCGYAIPQKISVTLTPSLNHRIFLLDRSAAVLSRSQYVLFAIPDNIPTEPKAPRVAIKRVACAPGDNLLAQAGQYYCNDVFLGHAFKTSSVGDPLPQFDWAGPVPAGQLFLMGDHERSYDSRYFGFVSAGHVRAVAHPVL